MRLRISRPKEFYAGLIFASIGALAAAGAQQYRLGTALRMGPGYFPTLLGIVLVLVGLASVVQGLRADKEDDPISKHDLAPLFFILAGIVGFALTVERFGLVAAIFVLVGLSCFMRLRSHPIEVLVTYLVLVTFSVGVFVKSFGLIIPVWWD